MRQLKWDVPFADRHPFDLAAWPIRLDEYGWWVDVAARTDRPDKWRINFVDVLGFVLAEDVPSTTKDGRPKRWVVVRPPGAATGLVLARADGEHQRAAIGHQFAGRVGLFLRVDSRERFDAILASVNVVTPPRDEPYGRVAVFADRWGNRWDLLAPRPAT